MSDMDRIDRKILRLLQEDGRQTTAEIAEKAGTSPATCHRRIQRLFEDGLISGVHARLNPNAVGRGTLVVVGAVLDRSTPESFSAFEAAVSQLKELLECHLVSGDVDYLLKFRVRDLTDYNRLHAEKLIALPSVRQIRSYFVLKEIKDAGLLPL